MTGARAERIVFEQKRAWGVQFLDESGRRCLAQARAEVLLAAGSIGSAQLLQVSGVGPGAHLQALGLPVVHDAPGVGGNLQDHLQLRLVYRVSNARTLNAMAGTWWGKALMAAQYAWSRSGPLSMAPSQLGAFARSSAAQTRANVQYHVQPLSLERFGEPLHPFAAFTASVCNLRPTSRGHVRIVSPDAQVAPEIQCNYLSTEADRQVAVDSIRLTRRIVAQPALARYRPEEYKPGPQAQSAEDLARAAGEIGTTIFHPVGTCRMGSDEAAVVDPQLRVRGVSGLRVIDASIMPTITSGNTNSPTIMIAEKGADMVRRARA